MCRCLTICKHTITDPKDEEQVREYLKRLLNREVFDKKGLIYGMGHAVYSISDPRAQIFKSFVSQLAHEKGRDADFALYTMVEQLAPEVIAEERKIYKGVSANVDFYSGFVYSMLDLPYELYTPMFAIARVVGWSAHRLEELINVDKIIRPAYRAVADEHDLYCLAESVENKGLKRLKFHKKWSISIDMLHFCYPVFQQGRIVYSPLRTSFTLSQKDLRCA